MHPEDNRHILQPAGQKKLARAMKEGIKNYFLSFVE
jgi:N-acetylmuramoyl-L-alanine amidase